MYSLYAWLERLRSSTKGRHPSYQPIILAVINLCTNTEVAVVICSKIRRKSDPKSTKWGDFG